MFNKAKPTIHKFNYKTCMGKSVGKLPFLSKMEQDEMDTIGYTGKNLLGERVTFEQYLNSLDKGTFDVEQTRFDSGEFIEEFSITRVLMNY